MKRCLQCLLIAFFIYYVILLFFVFGPSKSHAVELPDRAKQYIPILQTVTKEIWPDIPKGVYLAAQIEQETCISLKHSKCWSPRAEIKTSREYGFGFGQITVTKQFDNFKEAKRLDYQLKNWDFEDRYNPYLQLRALVAMDKFVYQQIKWTNDKQERMAFMFSAYNGGLGGAIKDRNICAKKKDCDSTKWFGHVELDSFRNKSAVAEYKKSFFEINREYVHNIMLVRYQKYLPLY